VSKFGIDNHYMFEFWDWVGGRYSMDSAIGAFNHGRHRSPIISAPCCRGFHQMDEHFRTAPIERNLPALMGLLSLWYNDFFDAQNRRRPALRAVPEAVSGVPAAVDDGEQRQTRHARRRPGDARHRSHFTGANRERTGSIPSIS
jgi:hypothetical protein